MPQPPLSQPPVKKPSLIGTMLRGAVGLGITGAILGGIAGAGALALGAVIPGVDGLVASLVSNLPVVGNLAVEGATATYSIGAGSAALAGLGAGAVGGAILGAPAGAVAAPIYAKQKQTEAAIPIIAQQAMQHVYQMGEQHGRSAGQQLEQESTKYRDMVAQQRGHAQSHSAGPSV